MQAVVTERGEPLGHTYAEPLSGLRVSWGSVLAGTVAMHAVALILWALAFAIVSLGTHATAASLKGSAIALWICGIAVTLVGAFVGGMVAGWLPGNPRRPIALAHGFLSWALALLLAFGFDMFVARGLVNSAIGAVADTIVAVEPGMAPGAGSLAPATPPVRRGPVMQPPGAIGPGATTPEVTPPSRADLAHAGTVALDWLIGLGWSWFGTWFVAGLLAIAGAGASVSRMTLRRHERIIEERRSVPPGAPLTPAPTA